MVSSYWSGRIHHNLLFTRLVQCNESGAEKCHSTVMKAVRVSFDQSRPVIVGLIPRDGILVNDCCVRDPPTVIESN